MMAEATMPKKRRGGSKKMKEPRKMKKAPRY
jgi:hypothetical protein